MFIKIQLLATFSSITSRKENIFAAYDYVLTEDSSAFKNANKRLGKKFSSLFNFVDCVFDFRIDSFIHWN